MDSEHQSSLADGIFMRECMRAAVNTIEASVLRMEPRPILSLG